MHPYNRAMRLPVIRGVIDRRLLVNFRIDPDTIRRILPEPFEPKPLNGAAIAGICLIRLKHVRPLGFPAGLGIASENAAHRIAVTWTEAGARHEGVFIPRRDTSSRVNQFAGGRLFPGVHHLAHFDVQEHDGAYHVGFDSDDGSAHALVDARVADRLPDSSVFQSIEEASAFFEAGSVGYSPASCADTLDGLELRTFSWDVRPMEVSRVESSFFGDERVFPRGAVEFDCALLMRGIEHEWHERGSIRAGRRNPRTDHPDAANVSPTG